MDAIAPNNLYAQFYCEVAALGAGGGISDDNQNNNASTPKDSPVLSLGSVSAYVCPYPISIVWWLTGLGQYRAIIGYCDDIICVVGLTLNCPFICSTVVQRGDIEKLLNLFVAIKNSEMITLMNNTSCREQWKLLLKQKSIGYIFPG